MQVTFDDSEVDIPLIDAVVATALNTDPGELTFNLGNDVLSSGQDFPDCESRSPCSGVEARAFHEGQCGWWFVLNYEEQRRDWF